MIEQNTKKNLLEEKYSSKSSRITLELDLLVSIPIALLMDRWIVLGGLVSISKFYSALQLTWDKARETTGDTEMNAP